MATNVPQTVWQPTDGNSDFLGGGVYNIDDASGVFLDDPDGVFIVDTGVLENLIPATVWTEDDSL